MVVLTDYSKAFDNIDFYTFDVKMHSFNLFLYWVFNYLTHRHFVQIDGVWSELTSWSSVIKC